jgi:hypothetical protein
LRKINVCKYFIPIIRTYSKITSTEVEKSKYGFESSWVKMVVKITAFEMFRKGNQIYGVLVAARRAT